MQPLISATDQSLLSQYQIRIEVDQTDKFGVIIFENRRFKIKLLERTETKSWQSIELQNNQAQDVAQKVAVMLLKKELLKAPSIPSTAPLNFKIERTGITRLALNQIGSTFISHEDRQNSKNTREDYNSLISYLTQYKGNDKQNGNENQEHLIEGSEVEGVNLLEEEQSIIETKEKNKESALSYRKNVSVADNLPFATIPRYLLSSFQSWHFPKILQSQLKNSLKNKGLAHPIGYWMILPPSSDTSSKPRLAISESSEMEKQQQQLIEENKRKEKNTKEIKEFNVGRLFRNPWLLSGPLEQPSSKEPPPFQSTSTNPPRPPEVKKWKLYRPSISPENDSFTMYYETNQLRRKSKLELPTQPTDGSRQFNPRIPSIFSGQGLSNEQKSRLDSSINPFT
jgi:hypothetical protein